MKEIYFDNSATTAICREALDRYIEVSKTGFGNPSSLHKKGKEAEDILKAARKELLSAIGGEGGSLVFTSSGTEANNLALFGRAFAKERYRGKKILTTAGEHASITEPLAALQRMGMQIVEIPTRGGALDMEFLASALTPEVILVSVMMVNNETGALYDIPALSRLIKQQCPDCALHIDATQAFFKLPISVRALGARLITLSSHKIEGPKGLGALYIDQSLVKEKGIVPCLLGGGQEGGFRSGTENVPGIAAFAAAVEYNKAHFAEFSEKTASLRAYLLSELQSDPALAGIKPVLPPAFAPHILNLILPNIRSEIMLHALSSDGIYVSSGSACSSNDKSHKGGALIAYGLSEKEADCSIRVSLSHKNEKEEIDLFLLSLKKNLTRLQRTR